ncbi:hypothetical protein [Thalassospira alkalitolerans]|uniref:hypothetical protein n=1 Tax=Thalassospira alkalitolerans TaxID=1293890 RepID=UPI0030EF5475|tara:strand:+ start:8233 stop:8772 length:540 start_codon:yes stop_codon:yes gene_type:complete
MSASSIAKEIMQERQRQIEDEGYDAHHDSLHEPDVIATGGAFYALPEETTDWIKAKGVDLWPFDEHPKRKDRRRDLIRAASMIVAEIEQIDEAERKHSRQVTLKGRIEQITHALDQGEPADSILSEMKNRHGASFGFVNGTYRLRLDGIEATRTAGKKAVLRGWCAIAEVRLAMAKRNI